MTNITTPAGEAGADLMKPGGFQGQYNPLPKKHKQDQRRHRGTLRRLTAAARAGLLAGWEAEFIISLDRQAVSRGWRPSPKQEALLHRIAASLDDDGPLIDHGDVITPEELARAYRWRK